MGLKAPKRWAVIVAVLFFFIGSILILSFALNKRALEEADICGYYEFGEVLFINPLSSFYPFKGDMPYYEISKNSLKFINNKDGSVQEFAGAFKKTSLDKDDFESLFMQMKSFPSPDIAQYKNRYQYATYLTESVREYRLYIMDREVWIADFHGKYIWSVYKLTKTDAIQISP